MTDRDRLLVLLKGYPEGFSRVDLQHRLLLSDRAMRDLIEDVVADSDWPILPPTVTGGVYRLAKGHEHELVNIANRQDTSRARSLHRKARGRREAFARRYQTGALFLDAVEEMDAA